MTHFRPQRHLSQDEMLLVLAQSDTLTPAAQDHLNQCLACRHEVGEIELRLNRLGETARRFTPGPARPFRLPRAEPTRSWRRWLTPALTTGLAAALVLSISVWWITPPDRTTAPLRRLTAEELNSDLNLMIEVDELVENAMPAPYRELAALSEPEWDEDLIDWIVPPIDDHPKPVS